MPSSRLPRLRRTCFALPEAHEVIAAPKRLLAELAATPRARRRAVARLAE